MNPGLWYLLARTSAGFVRRTRRRFRGGRGVMMLVGLAVLIAFLVVPQLFVFMQGPASGDAGETTRAIRSLGPTALLLLVLVTAARGGVFFKPAEIQFLFPAPIGRRELLVYDALSKLRVQALSGLWLSIFILAYAGRWYAAPIAAILVLAFWQLSAQAIGFLLAAFEARFGKLAQRSLMIGVFGLLIAGAVVAVDRVPAEAGALDWLEHFASLPPVAFLSWALRPLIEVYLAESFPALVLWTAVSIGLLALLLGFAIAFDFAYTEGAVERAQKVAARLERMRAGGGAFAAGAARRGGLRVPQLPYLGGAGPIAWRQLQELTRNYRGVLMLGLMVGVFIAVFLVMPSVLSSDRTPATGPPRALSMLTMLLIFLPMMTMHLAYDFRRDLDRMPLLKSLPISGFALAAGQIVPTAVLLSAWGLIALAVVSFALEPIGVALTCGIVLALLPFNAVLVAMDNVLFLLLPYRIVAKDPGRIPFMGRFMIVIFLKMLLLFVLAGLAAALTILAWIATGNSMLVTSAVVIAFLFACTVPMTFAVAAAFKRFDVSRDVPD